MGARLFSRRSTLTVQNLPFDRLKVGLSQAESSPLTTSKGHTRNSTESCRQNNETVPIQREGSHYSTTQNKRYDHATPIII